MKIPRGIRGVLVDVDGTLLDGDAAIPGAAEAVGRIRDAGLNLRFATNTTRRPRSAVAAALRAAGIDAAPGEIVLPASLARRRLLDAGADGAMLLVPEAAWEDFPGVAHVAEDPPWVVLGDLGAGFTFEILNQAFRALSSGASFLALHRNPSWWAGEGRGRLLDAGAFVAALEYASGKTAEVVGKPSPAFFQLAILEMGLAPAEVLVIGDSVENDFLGAARCGCRTVLVRGGAFREADLATATVRPDMILGSVADFDP